MVSHRIEQTGSAPFSGGAITPKAPTPSPNRRKKVKGKQKGQWGSWATEGAAAHLAGGVLQAQTPPTFLDTDREAGYLAEIDRLQARLNISDAQHAFSMQHVYGYPERYYVVPVRYYVVPTFFWVLWVLCIVPMGTVGYYRAAGYYGYCIVPTGTAVVPTGTTGTTVL